MPRRKLEGIVMDLIMTGTSVGIGAVASWWVVTQSQVPPYDPGYWFVIFLGGFIGFLACQTALKVLRARS